MKLQLEKDCGISMPISAGEKSEVLIHGPLYQGLAIPSRL